MYLLLGDTLLTNMGTFGDKQVDPFMTSIQVASNAAQEWYGLRSWYSLIHTMYIPAGYQSVHYNVYLSACYQIIVQ